MTRPGKPGPSRRSLAAGSAIAGLVFLAGAIVAWAAGPAPTASRVYGQAGSFATNDANHAGLSAASLYAPQVGLAVDANGGLYVADFKNNRVLHYPAASITADRVYGQAGSFASGASNTGGVTANSLNGPVGLAVDTSGGLYIVDSNNQRVLHYPSSATTADRVYGQANVFTTNDLNHGGLSAGSLSFPGGVAVDAAGGIYIGDTNNNRVLHYPSGSTTADRAYGQAGAFTTNDFNHGGISADSLGTPYGVAVDSSGGLYVAEPNNSRVLHYPSGSTHADHVYGQGGSFTTNDVNHGGVSANSLQLPLGVTTDSFGGLFIADNGNSRVLHFPAGSTTADRVWGQAGSFASNDSNHGGLSATSVSNPWGVGLDTAGGLYVSDAGNNRVLYFSPTPPWDVNGDGVVDIGDVVLIGEHWLQTGPPGWIPEDVNSDGVVDIGDVTVVGSHWLQTTASGSSSGSSVRSSATKPSVDHAKPVKP